MGLLMIKGILSFFTGGGMKSIENIASEWIETDQEKAEAKAVMVKTLDPNGMMRRELSRKVASLYATYLITTLLLLAIEFSATMFGWDINFQQLSTTTEKVKDLFLPISTLFGIIVTASFGVNYANTKQGK
jgi:hypothetical protein